ncbi:probable E3 ubiquitin-protein ligase RHB1A [Benincasa hispida]|uniref:probable E3 ubiquitin-protein ligase RHB1A n=1 Tax=Benincasa hispida TaxID=102211 RepID=UPI0018FF225C|nr:probable E3 ubiquitin-protein ligase RHB1A [Benincasa hispida]XP_038876113.1 probable E3 ubiquitin-protein ligase RHB1A [Benincasa hispida]XP_038876115.1 probable E3 ubiquitin-protein ligase RHB1A [Benincasa hispida]
MGGCCCCSSKRTESNIAPSYYYYPRASEEHVPLSSPLSTPPAFSRGLLVDTNLDTSIPDTYRSPPLPMPYDVVLTSPLTPPVAQEIGSNKNDAAAQTTNPDTIQETACINTRETSAKCEGVDESDCKKHTDFEVDTLKESEIELSKGVESMVLPIEEEDVCPICLEEYDGENPKLTTKCEHHFHLACILEWMERSDICPVCDQEMVFSSPID